MSAAEPAPLLRLVPEGAALHDPGAILDRFLHHAQVIAIQGRSYRVKDVAVAPRTPGGKRRPATPDEPAVGMAAFDEKMETPT